MKKQISTIVCLLGIAWEIIKTPYFYTKNWQKKTPKAKGKSFRRSSNKIA